MNWFRQNRWLGSFLILFGLATLLSLFFLWRARGAFAEATKRFEAAATERSRLERLDPFPSDANFEKMKFYFDDYAGAVDKMKEDLKQRMVPIAPLAPNEFQSRLRQVTLTTMEKARVNKVQLPRTFYMGFEEFASSLPTTAAAPLLGQQLSQIGLLLNILIDARVDSITTLKRTKLPEEGGAATSTSPPEAGAKTPATTAGPKVFERNIVDLTFVATQPAARKVLNQIASSSQQFYIIRTLYVKNEKDKGPPREGGEANTGTAGVGSTPVPASSAPSSTGGALKFIVGTEHIQTAIKVEMLRFKF
ncbi:MAG TPA: Amuc_1100 family pilus-like protein [Chthoniobacterales bacterium]